MKLEKTNKIIYFFPVIIVFFGAIFYFSPFLRAASPSPDAIAIRIIPNPNHYTALRWYQEQGFKGSPQSLLVDGYEAVRDGRTVYVAASNVAGDDLYTNIYFISHTQDIAPGTIDIFGQILVRWKFNANLSSPASCFYQKEKNCLIDADCPLGDYCLSDKAKTVRDTRRLGNLKEVEIALEAYKEKTGRYPDLSSGTYIPNMVISTWPSWQSVLGRELGLTLPVDPVNTLLSCPEDQGFDKQTCWNSQTNKFYDSDGDNEFELPEGSQVFVYAVEPAGGKYNSCSFMEGGILTEQSEGACQGSAVKVVEVQKETANNSAAITGATLPIGSSGREYIGYLEAVDKDGDPLTWTLDTSGTAWTKWSGPVELRKTANKNQRQIRAAQAGVEGEYAFKITIDDGRGSKQEKIYKISVANEAPVIAAKNGSYPASSTNQVNFSFPVQDDVFNYPLKHELTPAFDIPGLKADFVQSGNAFNFKITGVIDPVKASFPAKSTVYDFNLKATDYYDKSAAKNFAITITNNPPVVNDPVCQKDIRTNAAYPDCKITATDPEGNKIEKFRFATEGIKDQALPAGLGGNEATGVISGTPIKAGNYMVSVSAIDEFDYEGEVKKIPINVNTYCGDGLLQNPNMEKTGGKANDGREGCDGKVNVAVAAAGSSADIQYACTDNCVPTGGWYGDGIIQSAYEKCDDGDLLAGDGCSLGAIEPGWKECATGPGTCSVCGDNLIVGAEQCDSSNLNGKNCTMKGFYGGILSCNSSCLLNTSACLTEMVYTYAIPHNAGGTGEGYFRLVASWKSDYSGNADVEVINLCTDKTKSYLSSVDKVLPNGTIVVVSPVKGGYYGTGYYCHSHSGSTTVSPGDTIKVWAYLWGAYGNDHINSGTFKVTMKK